MTINFECGNCGKQLATPDEKAGKTGKCPDCGEPVSVPHPQSTFETDDPFDFDAMAQSFPPVSSPRVTIRACPMCGAEVSSLDQSCPSCGEELGTKTVGKASSEFSTGNRVDIGEVFSTGWKRYQEQMGTVIAAVLIAGFANVGLNLFSQVLLTTLNDPIATAILIQIISLLFNTWIYLGLFKLCLSVARGERTEVTAVFSGGKFYLRGLALNLLNLLMMLMLIGLPVALCVWLAEEVDPAAALIAGIPTAIFGIYVSMSLAWVLYVLIDTDSDPISCLKLSWSLMQGNYLAVFVLFFLSMMLYVVGVAMCCVGVIFTGPLAILIISVTYDHLSGGANRRPGDRF